MKNRVFGGQYGGFLVMILSVLGIVLWVTLFETILAAFVTLYGTGWTNFIAFATIVKIVPTVLFLAVLGGLGFGGYKGYSMAMGKGGINDLLMMVFGALGLLLFVTLFSSVMTAMETLRTADNVSLFIAFTTVVGIMPTVLFLAGVFGFGGAAVGGFRHRRSSRRQLV